MSRSQIKWYSVRGLNTTKPHTIGYKKEGNPYRDKHFFDMWKQLMNEKRLELTEKTNRSTTYKLTKRGSSSKYFPTRGFWISICFTSWKIQIFTSLYLLNNKASAKQCSGVWYKQWSSGIAHQNLKEYRVE